MIKDFVDNFLKFYTNLNPLGLIIFYGLIFIMILITVLLIVLQETNNKPSKQSKKKSDNMEVIDDSSLDNIGIIAKKIEAELDNNVINLTSFEEDQEESSIISYDELVNKTKPNEEEDKPTEIITEEVETPKRFVTTPVISPIFGYTEETAKKEKAKEYIRQINDINEVKPEPIPEEPIKQVNITSVNNDVKRNEDFLRALKNLKNNLN
ncbi:MAG: hypothetical protein PHS45_05045 [Bacilli bacterium]|nr:hypothetical protein [Bacilli bacterium]